jgi:hypothetical protein
MKQLHQRYAFFTIRARFVAEGDRIPKPLMLKYRIYRFLKAPFSTQPSRA